jgi:hypothetical protein
MPESPAATGLIQQVLGQLKAEEARAAQTRQLLAGLAPPEGERATTNRSRYYLAIAIIAVYTVSVLGVLLFFGLRDLACPNCQVTPYGQQMVDILKVVVLPVVTFMLGFYFGTGALTQGGKNPEAT